MIQPQELRIGNNVNTELGIAEVIGIYEDVVDVKGVSVIDNSSENKISISTRSFDGCVEYEKIQPIPLTEEILLKFGLKKIDDNLWQYKNGYLIGFYTKRWFIGKYNFDDMVEMITSFYYVHQLQNLYFSLTGKELAF